MNREIAIGRLKQVVGKTHVCLGRLTRNELRRINGRQLVILGKLQVVYGEAKQLAQVYSLYRMQ